MIISHNHPSGNLQPSGADKELTRKLKEAAGYMDIKLLDHLIVAGVSYLSLADEGFM
jgi:DNA repair protein RadC